MELPETTERLFALCDRLIEGQISAEEIQELEAMVLGDAGSRRLYVEYMHQHAALLRRGGAGMTEGVPESLIPEVLAGGPAAPKRRVRRWTAAIVTPLTLAAGVIIGLGLDLQGGSEAAKPVATLIKSQGCSWAGSILPTEEGARLVAGKLRLMTGVATIAFDSGATIQLEGPADLDLLSAKACALHQGSLVADVPPRAIGFRVQTDSTDVIDYGTRFGVIAGDSADTQVQVFEGLVEAEHRNSGEQLRLTTGQGVIFSRDAVTGRPATHGEPSRGVLGGPLAEAENMVAIATTVGRGRATYVQSGPANGRSQVSEWASLLLVKNTDNPDYRRKTYLSFDLAGVDRTQIKDATLTLSTVPSGIGYLAFTPPESRFTVHGITDDRLEGWQPESMEWGNAPGRRPGAAEVDPEVTIPVGTFAVKQEQTTGAFSISGAALTQVLTRDGNDLVSFVVVRDTGEIQGSGYAHAFAGNHHKSAAPPTLRLTMK